MHLLLIGPRASGKSSIGRRLARRLDRPFIDLDDRVAAQFAEHSIVKIWQVHGEAAWRAGEVDALKHVLADSTFAVVALGGGTPAINEAEQILIDARTASRVFTVYLRASVQHLAERLIRNPGDRPTLIGEDVVTEIESVLEHRAPIYEALADMICDTDDCDEDHVAVLIEHELRRRHVLPRH